MNEDNDREMLIRIDERVRGLVTEVGSLSSDFRSQMVTKPELGAVAARVARLELMTNTVIVSIIVAIVGAIMTLILRNGLA